MIDLEIPMQLADEWDRSLATKGKSATYWDIAEWAYQQGLAKGLATAEKETEG